MSGIFLPATILCDDTIPRRAYPKHATMPELPEVETTKRGIEPHIIKRQVSTVHIRTPKLRWPIPRSLKKHLPANTIRTVSRRAKYILIGFDHGTLITHLGMSGSMRICPPSRAWRKHDHFALEFTHGKQLRLHDPRKFGSVLWSKEDPAKHKLLIKLGPEPLHEEFDGSYLHGASIGRKASIKQHIMNHHIVVGVGNIYASEALFLSAIHPKRAAGRVSLKRMHTLAKNIKIILQRSIEQGGTTLNDFLNENGEPGYFAQQLNVYGRAGEQCLSCDSVIRSIVLGQRSTFYCPSCQR